MHLSAPTSAASSTLGASARSARTLAASSTWASSPPTGGYNVANAAAALAITVRAAASGGGTLDFVMLMPTDSYRRLRQNAYTIPNGEAIEDDGVEGGTYWLSGSSRYPTLRSSGAPLMVFPERDQRIYIILADENAGLERRPRHHRPAWYRPVYDNV